jgi:Methyltransferase domain
MAWNEIQGWAAFADLYNDYLTRHAKDGDVVVEIGLLFGRSLALLHEGAVERGLQLKIHGVDPFEDNGHWLPATHPYRDLAEALGGPYSAFTAMLFQHSPKTLEDAVIHRKTSLEGRKDFPDGSCALVMIDDDHSYEGCLASIQAWRSAVKPDGILAGDDFDEAGFPGVCRAVRESFGDDFSVHGTTWISGKYEVQASALVPAPEEPRSDASVQVRLKPGFALDTAWTVVETVGGARWVGKVWTEVDGTVTLRPAFEMPPAKLFFPLPRPGDEEVGVGQLELSNAPWSSQGTANRTVTVRWASRERLTDLPQAQQDMWVGTLAQLIKVLS